MSYADAGTEPVRRFEVFTGAGRRREWSDETKAAIVAESYSGLESVCAVARRHGLGHSQLFTWRRQLRRPSDARRLTFPAVAGPEPTFVPVVIEPPGVERKSAPKRRRSRSPHGTAPAMELEIDGVVVRVGSGASAKTIAAVISALKAGS